MEEVIFLVEESDEGGYIAKGMGVSIITEAESIEELKVSIKEAIRCHYDNDSPKLVRLHLVKEEVFAA